MKIAAGDLWLCAKALAVLATVTVAAAQVPPRSTPAPTNGTARLQGRIFDATTGAPIAGALVTLSPIPYPRTGPVAISTDNQGRFDFGELSSGRFDLRADASGYSGLAFGQRHPRELPRSFDLADKQTADISMGLLRAGVIVVRLTNELGEPLVSVDVEIRQVRWVNGERKLRQAMHGVLIRTDRIGEYGVTDDRGEVRVYGLAQGEYYVGATINAPRGALPTDGAPNAAPVSEPGGRVYATTYYPGTPVVTDAQPVTVGVGQEVEAAFTMALTRPVRISGRVIWADGQPLAGAKLTMPGPVALKADGTFESPAVAPGDYTLTATGGYVGLVPQEWGQTQVKARFEDVRGVTISMVKPGALRGRFVADDGVALRDLRPGTLQLQPTPLPGSYAGVVTPKYNADWTFEIGPIAGPYMLNLKQTPPGFYLKSILLAGADISREPFEVRGDRSAANLQVVVSRGAAEFSGTAVNRDDSPAQDYFVVLFPEDQGEWKPYSRFITSARADAQSKFAFTGLAPGRYLAAAVGYLDPGEERDLSVLQRLAKNATPVDLAANDRKTTSLRIVAY